MEPRKENGQDSVYQIFGELSNMERGESVGSETVAASGGSERYSRRLKRRRTIQDEENCAEDTSPSSNTLPTSPSPQTTCLSQRADVASTNSEPLNQPKLPLVLLSVKTSGSNSTYVEFALPQQVSRDLAE